MLTCHTVPPHELQKLKVLYDMAVRLGLDLGQFDPATERAYSETHHLPTRFPPVLPRGADGRPPLNFEVRGYRCFEAITGGDVRKFGRWLRDLKGFKIQLVCWPQGLSYPFPLILHFIPLHFIPISLPHRNLIINLP